MSIVGMMTDRLNSLVTDAYSDQDDVVIVDVSIKVARTEGMFSSGVTTGTATVTVRNADDSYSVSRVRITTCNDNVSPVWVNLRGKNALPTRSAQ